MSILLMEMIFLPYPTNTTKACQNVVFYFPLEQTAFVAVCVQCVYSVCIYADISQGSRTMVGMYL